MMSAQRKEVNDFFYSYGVFSSINITGIEVIRIFLSLLLMVNERESLILTDGTEDRMILRDAS